MIRKWIKKYRNKKELKKSNWGRDYGWFIEYESNIIGELVLWKQTDMFWYSYKVITKNKKWENIVFDEKTWKNSELKFLNKKYNKYAHDAFAGFVSGDFTKTKIIEMRMLHLTEL